MDDGEELTGRKSDPGEAGELRVRLLEGAISLGLGIQFPIALLGHAFTVTIGGHSGSIVLPTESGSADWKLVAPPLVQGQVSERLHDVRWGWRERGVDVVHAMTALLRFEIASDLSGVRSAGQQISEHAEDWRDSLLQWVQALTDQRCGCRVGRKPQQSGSMVFLWTLDSAGKPRSARTEGYVLADSPTFRPIESAVWMRALSEASSGSALPLVHALTNSAWCALELHDFRRAVLDAATATEVALVEAITACVPSSADAFVEFALKNKTLGWLESAARQIKLDVGSELRRRLIEPRNRVAHHGSWSDMDEAWDAAQVATETVRALRRQQRERPQR